MATVSEQEAGATAAGAEPPHSEEALAACVRGLLAAEPAAEAAGMLEQAAEQQPKALCPHIPKLVQLLYSQQQEIAQTSARILPTLTKTAPAKVAKHIDTLCERFAQAHDTARAGTVATFVGLSAASVAYQKRLIGVLQVALREAPDGTMERWAAAMLPTLKGEPYAAARAEVESRLAGMSREEGQAIARRLGVTYRGRPVRT